MLVLLCCNNVSQNFEDNVTPVLFEMLPNLCVRTCFHGNAIPLSPTILNVKPKTLDDKFNLNKLHQQHYVAPFDWGLGGEDLTQI